MNAIVESATKLAQNPLGLIALFVLLVEAIAGYVATSAVLSEPQRQILVWFVVSYPMLVLACFVYLVIVHPAKLYGPSDFRDQSHFMQALGIKVETTIEKISYEAEGELAALDIELIPIWEAESLKRPEDSTRKLQVLKECVERLERQVLESAEGSKSASVSALRRVYVQYLEHARQHYASSAPYQDIRTQVIKGLEAIRGDEI
ncbi:MAG: hypothetical protein QE278_03490 [Limnobacter sp.]|nr:hypothetical protein [Limnobacter sp.]